MLKGDLGLLAKNCGVSKTIIYRIAEKINLDLKPIHGRCDKTVDYISGTTLHDEQNTWLEMATQKILDYRQQRRERKVIHKAMDKKPVQIELAA